MLFSVWMIVGFQAVWFACAWGMAHHYPLLPILVGGVYLNTFIAKQPAKKSAYVFLAKVALGGFILDSLLGWLGLISFQSPYGHPFDWLQPWWMLVLWLSFGASIEYSFSWLKKTSALVFMGLLGGPVAYLSGQKIGGIIRIDLYAYPFIGLTFAIILPYYMAILRKQSEHNPVPIESIEKTIS